MVYRITILGMMLFAVYACRNNQETTDDSTTLGKNEMEDLNIYFVKKDRERIQNYIERRNLQMEESPTGLWFQIIKQGDGEFLKENDRVLFEYECSLLDGSKCYSSTDMGAKEVILGRSELEAGLNEGFRMLKPGAEAIFILPPYLAFGLIGDRNKIPPRSVVVYYVKILSDNK